MQLLNGLKYKTIAKKDISVLIQMSTTYLCESGSSCWCEIKSRKTNSITHIDSLMRVAILKRILFLNLKCWLIICNTKKVVKDNFWNLLFALSCVILDADCRAIVFLHVIFNKAFCLISNFTHTVHELVTRFLGSAIAKKVEEHWPKQRDAR